MADDFILYGTLYKRQDIVDAMAVLGHPVDGKSDEGILTEIVKLSEKEDDDLMYLIK